VRLDAFCFRSGLSEETTVLGRLVFWEPLLPAALLRIPLGSTVGAGVSVAGLFNLRTAFLAWQRLPTSNGVGHRGISVFTSTAIEYPVREQPLHAHLTPTQFQCRERGPKRLNIRVLGRTSSADFSAFRRPPSQFSKQGHGRGGAV